MKAITGFIILCVLAGSAAAGDLQVDLRAWTNTNRSTPLSASDELIAAAQDHANWLAHYGYEGSNGNGHDFGHGDSQRRAAGHGFTGSLIASNPGQSNYIVGECIAWGQNTPEEVIAGWMASKAGHWKALVAPSFDVCGFGHAISRSGRHIWVGMFGKQLPAVARTFEVGMTAGACPGGICRAPIAVTPAAKAQPRPAPMIIHSVSGPFRCGLFGRRCH